MLGGVLEMCAQERSDLGTGQVVFADEDAHEKLGARDTECVGLPQLVGVLRMDLTPARRAIPAAILVQA